jgi:hypothetical protein
VLRDRRRARGDLVELGVEIMQQPPDDLGVCDLGAAD